MDHPLIDLINARIAAAEADGAFDDLPGAGKPLPSEQSDPDGAISGILKRNGAVPEAVIVAQEMGKLRQELLDEGDRDRRRAILTELSMLQTKLDLARRRGG